MALIRPYQPDADEAAVFALWQATFPTWPLTRDVFHHVTVGVAAYRAGDHDVADDGGAIRGFVATQVDGGALPSSVGHLGPLFVAAESRRQGIGRALHDTALRRLHARGARRVQLGGGQDYLWPGIPTDVPEALPFFRAHGWPDDETTYDLAQDLRDFAAPSSVYRRVAEQGIRLETATVADEDAVLAFEEHEFPSWTASYRAACALGGHDDILLARDRDRRIIGTVAMSSPRSHPALMSVRWKTLLGEDAGAIGVVGVASAERGRDIAHALVARASEIVRERGAGLCYIGWTWMIGLYGDLGYRVWREYRMARRDLP